MKSIIKLDSCVTDFEQIESSDFKDGVRINVYSETDDLLIYNRDKEGMDGTTIFGLWVEFGKGYEKTIMLDAPINELELFASSILKQIEIIRNNFGEQIKIQHEMGFDV